MSYCVLCRSYFEILNLVTGGRNTNYDIRNTNKMKKILIIEDNQDIRENTAELLELAGYEVAMAENGKVGVEKAIANIPDIIICDIMMPVLDGYGVLHLIHKNVDLQYIPFIFLTAKSERSDFRKGMEMGADDYITKPFTEVELLSAIESRLTKADALREKFSQDADCLDRFIQTARGWKELENLTIDKSPRLIKKKQIIYSEGEKPNKLFFVQKGSIKTYKTNQDGKELITNFLKPGDFLGYVSLLEGGEYKETAEVMDDAELIVINKDEFQDLLHKNSEVAHRFIQLLANEISEREDQLIKLAYNSLRKRVADGLVAIVAKKGVIDAESGQTSVHMSREEMAETVGTATESLIRTLSDFKSEKLIEAKGSKVLILNLKGLQNLRG